MLPHELQQIPPEPSAVVDAIQTHQVTYEFYQEVKYREDFKKYCQWYYETAQKHQQELRKMRRDINFLGWFCRGHR